MDEEYKSPGGPKNRSRQNSEEGFGMKSSERASGGRRTETRRNKIFLGRTGRGRKADELNLKRDVGDQGQKTQHKENARGEHTHTA